MHYKYTHIHIYCFLHVTGVVLYSSLFGLATTAKKLSDIAGGCTGTEATLYSCPRYPFSVSCTSSNVAAVNCSCKKSNALKNLFYCPVWVFNWQTNVIIVSYIHVETAICCFAQSIPPQHSKMVMCKCQNIICNMVKDWIYHKENVYKGQWPLHF